MGLIVRNQACATSTIKSFIITVPSEALPVPEPLTPDDGATDLPYTSILSWQPVDAASAILFSSRRMPASRPPNWQQQASIQRMNSQTCVRRRPTTGAYLYRLSTEAQNVGARYIVSVRPRRMVLMR